MNDMNKKIAILCGGVGGSKFVEGMAQIVPSENLTIIGNTGDDFVHWGFHISPDLDTVMYRLANVVNRDHGWGRESESWHVMKELIELGAPDWFQLGDRDLAVHTLRRMWLSEGKSLTWITQQLCGRLGVGPRLLPMSDTPAPTMILSYDADEPIPFQEWFVKERWQPAYKGVQLPSDIEATTEVVEALESADLIFIAPSNPYVSVDPILNVNPIRKILERKKDCTAVISPLVGDTAVKGPLAKMMDELGLPVTADSIAQHYAGLAAGFVQDERDSKKIDPSNLALLMTDSLMHSVEDERRLAEEILAWWADQNG